MYTNISYLDLGSLPGNISNSDFEVRNNALTCNFLYKVCWNRQSRCCSRLAFERNRVRNIPFLSDSGPSYNPWTDVHRFEYQSDRISIIVCTINPDYGIFPWDAAHSPEFHRWSGKTSDKVCDCWQTLGFFILFLNTTFYASIQPKVQVFWKLEKNRYNDKHMHKDRQFC